MPVEWKKTKQPGARFYYHPSRKVRGNKATRDRYYSIRYQANLPDEKTGEMKRKQREEGVGWLSDGWTLDTVAELLTELRRNNRNGTPPFTLRQKREMEEQAHKEQSRQDEIEQQKNITFGGLYEQHYLPSIKRNYKPKSWQSEDSLYRHWIAPVIASRPLSDVRKTDITTIRNNIKDGGRSERRALYALTVIRAAYNLAIEELEIYGGPNPALSGSRRKKKKDKEKLNNFRVRWLRRNEAEELLEALAKRSLDVHDMALLSLNTGMRAGEIFALTWRCVDTETGTITMLDPKGDVDRHAYMNESVKCMFEGRQRGKPGELVFPNRKGGVIEQISDTYNRTVTALKFNEGVTDDRERVVFHTLRHTFASWLVLDGVDLYRVSKLLGHKDIQTTMRYAHLAGDELRGAVARLAATG